MSEWFHFCFSLQQYLAWLGEASDNSGPSESEDGGSKVRSKPVLLNRPSQAFDYVEAVNSASSISTPPHEPFASDDLGDTVVKLDKAVARMRLLQKQSEDLAMPPLSPLKGEDSGTQSDSMVSLQAHCIIFYPEAGVGREKKFG